ncbi:hypothetical protein HAX54_049878 [Datura stramonium]|uniref:Fe2OG dioxygenase domain-containing protein n=1 Tax=Datura stramonium TaxID=4076 RepID=A0ABS8SVK5_DATST|nr:hypothetical protein [Datura stramonium]
MDYEKKAICETKAGIKGLVDSGIIPVVDLSGIEVEDRRKKIVDEIRDASEKWGFFQLINHGVPSSVLDGMIPRIRKFHEQDVDVKKEYYSPDPRARQVRYDSNLQLFKTEGNPVFLTILLQDMSGGLQVMRDNQWADVTPIEHGLVVNIGDFLQILSNDKFVSAIHRAVAKKVGPRISVAFFFDGSGPTSSKIWLCSLNLKKYRKFAGKNSLSSWTIRKLEKLFFKLTTIRSSWAKTRPLKFECVKGQTLVCHYYPACPQPELTLVNIGDFLQILSNDKFLSVNHRVLANKTGPRISVACFFTGVFEPPKMYGPIKELISEEKTPLYKEFLVSDYITEFFSRPILISLSLIFSDCEERLGANSPSSSEHHFNVYAEQPSL